MEISAEVKAAHRITWFVYTGEADADGNPEKIRWQSTMRGFWPGFDVTCRCGWETKTGGGTRGHLREQIEDHKLEAQQAAGYLAADTANRVVQIDGHTHLIGTDGHKICPSEGGPQFLASRERDDLSCVTCNLLLRWARNFTEEATAR